MTHHTNIHTPYHELGAGTPCVPTWATHRSVYRTAGHTLYLVTTDTLDTARHDLETLANRGWEVHIDAAEPDQDLAAGTGGSAPHTHAQITLLRRAA